MRDVLVVFAALLALVPWSPAAACDFKLGFAGIHGELADRVGDCLTDEHYDATTGDALQETTGGLLVWRRADNTVAFTDGATTWLESRFGLVVRANGERFAWEGPPPPPPPLAGRGRRRRRGALRLSGWPDRRAALRHRHAVPLVRADQPLERTDARHQRADAVFRRVRRPGARHALPRLAGHDRPPTTRGPAPRRAHLGGDLYALMPGRPGLAPAQPPATVELYRGRMPGARSLVATLPLG